MKLRMRLLFTLLVCFTPIFANATLGEPMASIQKDAGQLKAMQKAATVGEKFSVSEMQADGNTIKQYSNGEGIVFAVTWMGISKPDLKTLFGKYFAEYTEGSNEVPKLAGAKTISFKTSQMVIRRGGRMRDQRGLAFIPSLVPAGINAEDLP